MRAAPRVVFWDGASFRAGRSKRRGMLVADRRFAEWAADEANRQIEAGIPRAAAADDVLNRVREMEELMGYRA